MHTSYSVSDRLHKVGRTSDKGLSSEVVANKFCEPDVTTVYHVSPPARIDDQDESELEFYIHSSNSNSFCKALAAEGECGEKS